MNGSHIQKMLKKRIYAYIKTDIIMWIQMEFSTYFIHLVQKKKKIAAGAVKTFFFFSSTVVDIYM